MTVKFQNVNLLILNSSDNDTPHDECFVCANEKLCYAILQFAVSLPALAACLWTWLIE